MLSLGGFVFTVRSYGLSWTPGTLYLTGWKFGEMILTWGEVNP